MNSRSGHAQQVQEKESSRSPAAVVLALAAGALVGAAITAILLQPRQLPPSNPAELFPDRAAEFEKELASTREERDYYRRLAELLGQPSQRVAVPDSGLADKLTALGAALEDFRQQNAGKDTEIQRLLDLVDKLKGELPESLRAAFYTMPEAQALPEDKRELVAGYLLPVLGELPNPWEVQPLAEAEADFRPKFQNWQRRWSEQASEASRDKRPWDPSSPGFLELRQEKEDLMASYRQALERAGLGQERLGRFFPP